MSKRTLRPQHQEDIKAKIKGVHLALFLQEYALKGEFNGLQINPKRVDAALGLLRKVLPDLASAELSVNVAHFTDTLARIAALEVGNAALLPHKEPEPAQEVYDVTPTQVQ